MREDINFKMISQTEKISWYVSFALQNQAFVRWNWGPYHRETMYYLKTFQRKRAERGALLRKIIKISQDCERLVTQGTPNLDEHFNNDIIQ